MHIESLVKTHVPQSMREKPTKIRRPATYYSKREIVLFLSSAIEKKVHFQANFFVL